MDPSPSLHHFCFHTLTPHTSQCGMHIVALLTHPPILSQSHIPRLSLPFSPSHPDPPILTLPSTPSHPHSFIHTLPSTPSHPHPPIHTLPSSHSHLHPPILLSPLPIPDLSCANFPALCLGSPQLKRSPSHQLPHRDIWWSHEWSLDLPGCHGNTALTGRPAA